MRQPQFIRSNTFHRALMVAGVFAVFVIALFGFIYWQIDDYLTARSDRVITLEIEGISSLSPERRLQAIDEKLRQDPRGVQLAAIFAADGHRITGNIEGLPAGLRIDAAAQAADIVKINGNGPEHQIIRAIARHMRNGDVLVLGRNVDEAREISHVVGQALGLGLLPAFLLCLLAGAWLSVRAQKRVEEVLDMVELSTREFDLLTYLMRHPEQVLSRAQILDAVWGLDFDPETKVVDVYISSLRRKLAANGSPAPIETIRQAGYRLLS